jgi:outer membrane biosynthesis protein TonB
MLPTNPLLNATAPAGPHLPLALLRQYATGTLAPAAQHRVEAHTLGCPRCADILEGLLQTPPATTDQAVAQLQQRLRQRVQQVAAPGRQGPRLAPRPRWLALQLAAAATLLLCLVAGGWWAWQQRHIVAPAAAVAPGSSPATTVPPAIAPILTSDIPSFHEKLRHEAAKFVPKAPGHPLSGTVQLRLTIDETGKLMGIRVIRSLRADYDAEAERLVRNTWVPDSSSERPAARHVDVAVPF